MRYNSIVSIISTVLTVLTVSCSSLPSKPSNLTPDDCLHRLDCRVITVDNTNNQYDIDFRINGTKYGNIQSYSTATYSLFTNRLVDGNCATVTAKFSGTNITLVSPEQCINSNEFYRVNVTSSPRQIWIATFRVK